MHALKLKHAWQHTPCLYVLLQIINSRLLTGSANFCQTTTVVEHEVASGIVLQAKHFRFRSADHFQHKLTESNWRGGTERVWLARLLINTRNSAHDFSVTQSMHV